MLFFCCCVCVSHFLKDAAIPFMEKKTRESFNGQLYKLLHYQYFTHFVSIRLIDFGTNAKRCHISCLNLNLKMGAAKLCTSKYCLYAYFRCQTETKNVYPFLYIIEI